MVSDGSGSLWADYFLNAGKSLAFVLLGLYLGHLLFDERETSKTKEIDSSTSKTYIHSVVDGARGDFRKCFRDHLSKRPGASGSIRLRFHVSEYGRVDEASVSSSTMNDPALHTCALNRLKSLRFDAAKSAAQTWVSYPITFKSNARETPP